MDHLPKQGKVTEHKELKWIRIDEDTLANWQKEGAMRHFPLDARTMHSLTGREATLYKIIFNEMLGRGKWRHSGCIRGSLLRIVVCP